MSIDQDSLEEASEAEAAEERLDLSGTGLERIPEALVTSWPDLRELVISRNRVLDNLHLLERLPGLRRLVVSANQWTALPAAVSRLRNLRQLDISDNRLAVLSEDLANLTKLEELRVDRNVLVSLPGREGSFPKLKHLSASHNQLGVLPAFLCRSKDMRALHILETNEGRKDSDSGLGGEELRTVNLRANCLKGNIILGNYGNLTQLDVSENSIESLDLSALDKLENVQCSKNQLLELSLNGTALVSLIAGNNKLQRLSVTPRPSKLKHLDISYNDLSTLPEWIAGCHHLRSLFASHNQLTSLPDHLFCSELSCLQTLQLSFNKLISLPAVIRHIPLQQLFLQSNCISSLPEHFFVASSRMRVLNISNNCLQSLPTSVADNHQLETLLITANLITDLSPLVRFANLRTLHAAYNTIHMLPDSCTSAWPELEEIVLSGNQITQLPENITQLRHLRVLRIHSNLLRTCPSVGSIAALRVLDLAHNQLDRVNLAAIVSQRLQFLDISGNARLHVDAKQFQAYRHQRAMSLVDVSGQNRSCIPSSPPHQEVPPGDLASPWTLGFSETPGQRDRLCISQLRLPGFCNTEALLGLFDSGNNADLPQLLVKAVPRILLEERTVKETASDYMKYTLLSAHRELKEAGQRCGLCAVVCHITRQWVGGPRRYVLRIASVGEAKALLSRTTGSLTFAHAPPQSVRSQLGNSAMFPMVVPDPHVTEIVLTEQDEFLIIANKSLWEVMSVQESVKVVRPVRDAVLAAKKLQDMAQSYGCEDNLSVLVLRFHSLSAELDPFVQELRTTLRKATSHGNMLSDGEMEGEGDRSSPSGQSDQASSGRHGDHLNIVQTRHYVADKNDLITPRSYQSVLMHENGTRKMTPKHKGLDLYTNGNLADAEETSSDRSTALSEEQFRCWEYMLEQNTQLLFDKELDTLSRGFIRRSVPSRPTLWPRTRSNPALNEPTQPALLSRHFGSARSFHPIPNRPLGTVRSLHGGPNAAYFGSLQRLMPYHLEYDFAVIRERSEPGSDSLEQDGGRMHKYWDVATTEL
ncbi:protein phosphatase PHLPP-like protein isoform X2 [Macrosteles quadrilineatus]|uniref:protein phosphatase PHLPP-like protein isoform X2 n=1 Tax=Macrosteles quadrilineatus TaxID=74068 RepID=UPI0023E11692|nr:protein phosphatase PHLPP-like protein isoform X2 [Macrosteles quadrilineatus]